MSKAEILHELPNLRREERREIFERICDIEENDILQGAEPTTEEKALLDRELEEFQLNPNAGSSWPEVQARLRTS